MLTKREGLIMYWCEGNKTDKVAITNSDFLILKEFIDWIETYYNIPHVRLRVTIRLWKGKENIESYVREQWSQLLHIPITQFWKTNFSGSGTKDTHPLGMCRVSVNSKPTLNQILLDIKHL